jgi:thymidylate synthase (FAD)
LKVIEPRAFIVQDINGEEVLEHIERCGRVCYKSEDRIKDGSAERFIGMLVRSGHESVLEHFSFTAKFICDRGVTHEIVRHRIASFSQESTRYVDYTLDKNGGEIEVIIPYEMRDNEEAIEHLKWAVGEAEDAYRWIRYFGCKAQAARAVLPTCLKTELYMTANLREWRHFFKMRCSKAAHPDIRVVANMLLKEAHDKIPVVFDDIYEELYEEM